MGKALLNFWGENGRFDEQPYFKKYTKDNKKGYAVEIRIPVDDIEDYYTNIKDKVNVTTPLKDKRWGARDFRIEDVNGFYLCFTEPHDWIFDFEGYKTDKDE